MSTNERPNDEAVRESSEAEAKEAGANPSDEQPHEPLFLRGRSDGRKGNAQDEKDQTGE